VPIVSAQVSFPMYVSLFPACATVNNTSDAKTSRKASVVYVGSSVMTSRLFDDLGNTLSPRLRQRGSLALMLAARTDRQRGVNCCSRNNWSVNSSVACMTQYNQPDIKMHCVGNEPRTNTKKCSILRSIFYKIRVCAAIRSLAIRQ